MPKKSRGVAVKRRSGAKQQVPTKQNCVEGPLCFLSPASLFKSLIEPMSPEQFFWEYWEKQPLHLQRKDPRVAHYYRSLFQLSDLQELGSEDLEYYRDINTVRCMNGKKKVFNKAGKVKYDVLIRNMVQNKATVQFHQPQRFKDELWRIQENLESFFGALVGSNVYITPPDSQGLPAHYDDVEVFILQLEGQKQWRLYKPIVPLAADYSIVTEETLGTATHDITLKAGDLLYFPRGTIHQASTLPGANHSTHLTISTYQKMSWGDLLLDILPGILCESSRTDVTLRYGMPMRFLLGGGGYLSTCRDLATYLRHLADRIETEPQEIYSAHMKRDFIMNRLPPFCQQNQLAPSGKIPVLEDTVCLRFKDHMLITVEPSQRTTDEVPELAIFVLHSLKNHRKSHMMSAGSDQAGEHNLFSGLQFPLSHLQALQQLQQVERLPVAHLQLAKPEDKLSLVLALWSESLLNVL